MNELAAQNLRLVDFEVTTVSGQRRWCGVWRSGTDGYYVWINADWQHFLAKWNDLAAQGLRLVGLRFYGGLWAGIWRSGTDAYYLWANANESSFLAKWGGLAQQNLRLIDVIATPFGGAAGSGPTFVGERPAEELFGASELTGGGHPGTGTLGPAGERAEPVMETPVAEGAGFGGGSIATVSEPGDGLETGGAGEGTGSAIESSAAGATGFGGGNVSAAIGPRGGSESTGAGTGGGSAQLGVASRPTTPGAGAGGGVLPGEAEGAAAGPVGCGGWGGNVDLDVAVSPPVEESGAEVEGHGVHLSGPSES